MLASLATLDFLRECTSGTASKWRNDRIWFGVASGDMPLGSDESHSHGLSSRHEYGSLGLVAVTAQVHCVRTW